MAMTKAEKKVVEELREEIVQLKAFRRTAGVARDVPIPSEGVVFGWSFNLYAKRVYESWSKRNSNGQGHIVPPPGFGSSNGIAQFSTKARALRALRYDMEKAMSKELSLVDIEIEK